MRPAVTKSNSCNGKHASPSKQKGLGKEIVAMTVDENTARAKLREIGEWILKQDAPVLLYNYDADGCSAGASMAAFLSRSDKKFESLAVKQLYKDTIAEIKAMGTSFIFVDFGSGQLEELVRVFGPETFCVLDHHQPVEIDYRLHWNPFHYGIHGGREISAAGIAFWLAYEMDPANADLACLAVVGACGDMQDESGKLEGKNADFVKIGVSAGVLSVKTDLRLFGRISRPLAQYLMFSTSPVLPELTANENNCKKFLADLGIDEKKGESWRSYEDLRDHEKKALASALINHLHRYRVPEWKIHEMIGEVYTLEKEEKKSPVRDAKEFGTLLNACGRHGRADIGLAVCTGDRFDAYEEALALLVQHRRELREGITLMHEKGLEEFESFFFFDSEGKIADSIIGIVAGMLYGSGTIGENKPIVALSRLDEENAKASGRATRDLVRRGLNIGKAFRRVCEKIGDSAEGGGHAIAAGCKFPMARQKEFLDELNIVFKEQLGI